MILTNQAPLYAEVDSSDGTGVQLVPGGEGRRVRVLAMRLEGSSGHTARLKETDASGTIIDTFVCPFGGAANKKPAPGFVWESSDGLYVQRVSFTRLCLWYQVE